MTKYHSIIFGLTADPIHKGHEQAIINSIEYMHERGLEINEFILVPVFQPNLIANKKAPVASFEHRYEMCEIVASRLSSRLSCNIRVSKIERKLAEAKGDINYSLNTLKQLDLQNCLFMVSADHFQGRWPKFRKWLGWQEILKYSGLLINHRPGHKINTRFIDQLRQINPKVFLVESDKSVDTSSSEIRANFYSSEMNIHLSQEIVDYINKHNLYLSLS